MTNIDLIAEVKNRVDLVEDVIVPDIGPPARQGKRLSWNCPFHPDRNPSLFLNPDGQSYRCFGCGARGDAYTWLMERNHWSFRQALHHLADLVGLDESDRKPRVTKRRPPTRSMAQRNIDPPSAKWQARGRAWLERAQGALWSDVGGVGLDYLHARGLRDDTIRTWGLGWCPADFFDPPTRWGLTGKHVYIPRGVVIPHYVDDNLWALKIRRFDENQPVDRNGKYGGPRGGQTSLYGVDRLRYSRHPLMIVEAELDALLLWQEAGDQFDVVALAGAARGLSGQWLARLLPYSRIYAALDADPAGTQNTKRLTALSQRFTPASIPVGDDPTEYYQDGGDLRSWALSLLPSEKANNRPPTAASKTVRFPLTMIIPPEKASLPGLALPNNSWKRRSDGSIKVVFRDAHTLDVCTRATQAIRNSHRLSEMLHVSR
jgi:DNA primase